MLDVIVVGAGPAGLSAALTLGRQRRDVLVVDSGEPRNAPAEGVHMLLSRDGVPPAELRRWDREDLAAYATVQYRETAAVSAARAGDGFEVTLSGDTTERARSLILATGIADVMPELDGVAGRFGKSVFHCPFCHGFEARDQPLAVLGNDFVHAVLALYLADRLSSDVIVCTGGPQRLGDELMAKLAERGVGVREGELAAIEGDFGQLKVVFADGEVLERGAVFLHPGVRQKSPLAAQLGCETLPDGSVRVDERQATTVPGVFAAGDMARLATSPGPMPFAVTGAADGVRAAIWADQALLIGDLGLDSAGPRMTPGADQLDSPLLDPDDPPVAAPPDAELAALAEFSGLLDRMALLAMCRTLRRAGLFSTACTGHTLAEIQAALRVAPRHHRVIRRWLTALERENMLVREALTERYVTLHAADAAMLREARGRLIAALPHSGYSEELARFFLSAMDYLPELVRDDISLQSLLFEADTSEAAEGIYRDNSVSRHINAIAAAAVAEAARRAAARQETVPQETGRRGPFRVLEVGAGVGGTSAGVLSALAPYRVSYQFTDVSRFFLTSAERRFAEYDWITFGTFDMNRDYADQGYAPASADTILAANVLHNARDADWVLGKLAELLAPGGWLVFIETCRELYQIMASMEFLMSPPADDAGFDFGDFRHGRDRIFITRDEWLALLDRAGFGNVTCLPAAGSPLAGFGQHVFAAQKGH